jgi:hypothetical protein
MGSRYMMESDMPRKSLDDEHGTGTPETGFVEPYREQLAKLLDKHDERKETLCWIRSQISRLC